MLNYLLGTLKKLNIVNDCDFLVSVSGGVDSMVLLYCLIELSRKQLINNRLLVVTFDHHKRIDSKDDAFFVKQYCMEHNVECLVKDIEVESSNFQHNARNLRLEILKNVASQKKIKYILTAHHANDLVESILIKFLRGSNMYGYSGFHQIRNDGVFTFLKPLFYQSKEDIMNFQKENNIPYHQDSSNDEDDYLRNKLRHNVVNKLVEYNPSLLTQATRYHETLFEYFTYVRNKTIKHLSKNALDLPSFLKLDPIIKKDLISYLLENFDIEFNSKIVSELVNILENITKRSLIHQIDKDFILIKDYGSFRIEKIPQNELYYTLKYQNIPFEGEGLNKNYILCYNNIDYPLITRNPKSGDQLKMTYGTKSLKKLMIEKRIPSYQRSKLLVLVDKNDNILFVEDIYINKSLGDNQQLYIKKIPKQGVKL
jgi:tRNA(Ile)-lysidine synthase